MPYIKSINALVISMPYEITTHMSLLQIKKSSYAAYSSNIKSRDTDRPANQINHDFKPLQLKKNQPNECEETPQQNEYMVHINERRPLDTKK